jgi:hypothetical protein
VSGAGSRRRALAALALLAVLAAGGCAARATRGPVVGGECLPAGRSLVVARLVTDEDRANAEAAADLLVNALRDAGLVVGPREFLGEAHAVGLGVWASGLADRLQKGGGTTLEEGRVLGERFDIRTIVGTELREYDQVWGKYAKFTRAGVDAQAVDVGTDRVLWRQHSDIEVEAMRGRAFRFAMEQAVQDLAGTICPRRDYSLTNTWRSWRR